MKVRIVSREWTPFEWTSLVCTLAIGGIILITDSPDFTKWLYGYLAFCWSMIRRPQSLRWLAALAVLLPAFTSIGTAVAGSFAPTLAMLLGGAVSTAISLLVPLPPH
jgi:hypothetical protein